MATNVQPESGGEIRRRDLLAWGTVRSGLALNFGGRLVMLLCAIILVVIARTSETPQPKKDGVSMLVVLIAGFSLCGLVAGVVLALVGACMGSAAPRSSAAKRFGIATCVFTVFLVGLFIILSIAELDAMARETARKEQEALREDPFGGAAVPLKEVTNPLLGGNPPFSEKELLILGHALQGAFVLTTACYMLCLHCIARRFGRDGLAVGVLCYLIFFLLCVAGMNVLAHSESLLQNLPAPTVIWLVVGGSAFLLLWELITVGMVRGALTAGLLRE